MRLFFYAFLLALYSCSSSEDCVTPTKWVYKIDIFSMSGRVYETIEEVVVVDSMVVAGNVNLLFLSNGHAVEYLGCSAKRYYVINDGELNVMHDVDQKNVDYPFTLRSLDDEVTVYNLHTTCRKDTVLSGNIKVKAFETPATRSTHNSVTYSAHTTYFSDSLGLFGTTFYDERGNISYVKKLVRVESKPY